MWVGEIGDLNTMNRKTSCFKPLFVNTAAEEY